MPPRLLPGTVILHEVRTGRRAERRQGSPERAWEGTSAPVPGGEPVRDTPASAPMALSLGP